jgi:hypothetical protein
MPPLQPLLMPLESRLYHQHALVQGITCKFQSLLTPRSSRLDSNLVNKVAILLPEPLFHAVTV